MKIDIITAALSRDLYVEKMIHSVMRNLKYIGNENIEVRHIILWNNHVPSENLSMLLAHYKESLNGRLIQIYEQNDTPLIDGQTLNIMRSHLDSDITMKMDDDCEIVSTNFFNHMTEIYNMLPNTIFSPYPVGLIGNPGGVPKNGEHFCLHSEKMNTYYTFRPVDHIGGFARICPTNLIKDFEFGCKTRNEDVQFSNYWSASGIFMVYLENAMIVEHQESTLGQHERYPEYFKGRF